MEHHLVNHGLCSALSQLFELRDKDNLNRGMRFLLVSSPLFFGGVFFFSYVPSFAWRLLLCFVLLIFSLSVSLAVP